MGSLRLKGKILYPPQKIILKFQLKTSQDLKKTVNLHLNMILTNSQPVKKYKATSYVNSKYERLREWEESFFIGALGLKLQYYTSHKNQSQFPNKASREFLKKW